MKEQVQDVEGVELCGTLKNVVAIAAGLFVCSVFYFYFFFVFPFFFFF